MKKLSVPIRNRVVVLVLVPVTVVGLLISGIFIAYFSTPISTFLHRQFHANLRLASKMGLDICENKFDSLLNLRFEDDLEMNKALKREALDEIKNISRHFCQIHLMVIEGENELRAASTPIDTDVGFPQMKIGDQRVVAQAIGGKAVRAHMQYFPLWQWRIISFIYEKDYKGPIHNAYEIVYLRAAEKIKYPKVRSYLGQIRTI